MTVEKTADSIIMGLMACWRVNRTEFNVSKGFQCSPRSVWSSPGLRLDWTTYRGPVRTSDYDRLQYLTWTAVDRGPQSTAVDWSRPQLTTVPRSNTEEKMLSRILDDSRWGAQIRPVFYSRNSSNSLYFLASFLAPRIMPSSSCLRL
jgi:hypothetical protein